MMLFTSTLSPSLIRQDPMVHTSLVDIPVSAAKANDSVLTVVTEEVSFERLAVTAHRALAL